jgi:hypothetical protein
MLQFIRCKTEETPGLSCGTGGASSRRLGPGGLAISGGTLPYLATEGKRVTGGGLWEVAP